MPYVALTNKQTNKQTFMFTLFYYNSLFCHSGEVWTYKTSLNARLFIEVAVQSQKIESYNKYIMYFKHMLLFNHK
jgi:hypothetical protein